MTMLIDVKVLKCGELVEISARLGGGVYYSMTGRIMEMGSDPFWNRMDAVFGRPIARIIRATPQWFRLEYELDARFAAMDRIGSREVYDDGWRPDF